MMQGIFLAQAIRRSLAALTAGCALLTSVAAHADLMLYPTRVVIAGKQRSAQVEIINRGSKPETYRINIVNRRMTQTGEIVAADQPQEGDQFADTMLVYTPRQVTLAAGAAQTVRISVRKPAGLADGEYRSHIQFDRVPDATAGSDLESIAKPDKGQVEVVLQALIGASIPVIVRQGETHAAVTLDTLAIVRAKDKAPPALSFVFHRQGNRSVYGDVIVTYASPSHKTVAVGKVDGVAVYVPNASRYTQLPLTLPEGLSLHGGTLTLLYSERADAGGALLAKNQISVP
jgi:fimbrial chaperone protein